MSILIKGMEMPEHCGECKLKAAYDDETFCPFFADNVEYWIAAGRRHEDCPLFPVPSHGDLIDRDPFVQFIKSHWDSSDQWFVEQLEARPTIIPAEEGET